MANRTQIQRVDSAEHRDERGDSERDRERVTTWELLEGNMEERSLCVVISTWLLWDGENCLLIHTQRPSEDFAV